MATAASAAASGAARAPSPSPSPNPAPLNPNAPNPSPSPVEDGGVDARDTVRAHIERDGRAARNLLSWFIRDDSGAAAAGAAVTSPASAVDSSAGAAPASARPVVNRHKRKPSASTASPASSLASPPPPATPASASASTASAVSGAVGFSTPAPLSGGAVPSPSPSPSPPNVMVSPPTSNNPRAAAAAAAGATDSGLSSGAGVLASSASAPQLAFGAGVNGAGGAAATVLHAVVAPAPIRPESVRSPPRSVSTLIRPTALGGSGALTSPERRQHHYPQTYPSKQYQPASDAAHAAPVMSASPSAASLAAAAAAAAPLVAAASTTTSSPATSAAAPSTAAAGTATGGSSLSKTKSASSSPAGSLRLPGRSKELSDLSQLAALSTTRSASRYNSSSSSNGGSHSRRVSDNRAIAVVILNGMIDKMLQLCREDTRHAAEHCKQILDALEDATARFQKLALQLAGGTAAAAAAGTGPSDSAAASVPGAAAGPLSGSGADDLGSESDDTTSERGDGISLMRPTLLGVGAGKRLSGSSSAGSSSGGGPARAVLLPPKPQPQARVRDSSAGAGDLMSSNVLAQITGGSPAFGTGLTLGSAVAAAAGSSAASSAGDDYDPLLSGAFGEPPLDSDQPLPVLHGSHAAAAPPVGAALGSASTPPLSATAASASASAGALASGPPTRKQLTVSRTKWQAASHALDSSSANPSNPTAMPRPGSGSGSRVSHTPPGTSPSASVSRLTQSGGVFFPQHSNSSGFTPGQTLDAYQFAGAAAAEQTPVKQPPGHLFPPDPSGLSPLPGAISPHAGSLVSPASASGSGYADDPLLSSHHPAQRTASASALRRPQSGGGYHRPAPISPTRGGPSYSWDDRPLIVPLSPNSPSRYRSLEPSPISGHHAAAAAVGPAVTPTVPVVTSNAPAAAVAAAAAAAVSPAPPASGASKPAAAKKTTPSGSTAASRLGAAAGASKTLPVRSGSAQGKTRATAAHIQHPHKTPPKIVIEKNNKKLTPDKQQQPQQPQAPAAPATADKATEKTPDKQQTAAAAAVAATATHVTPPRKEAWTSTSADDSAADAAGADTRKGSVDSADELSPAPTVIGPGTSRTSGAAGAAVKSSGARIHDKLSSPKRQRGQATQQSIADKQLKAARLRDEQSRRKRDALAATRKAAAQAADKAALLAAFTSTASQAESAERQTAAEAAHSEHLQAIRAKAQAESQKVREIAFIAKLDAETRADDLKRKLAQGETRRKELLATRVSTSAARGTERHTAVATKRKELAAQHESKIASIEKRHSDAALRNAQANANADDTDAGPVSGGTSAHDRSMSEGEGDDQLLYCLVCKQRLTESDTNRHCQSRKHRALSVNHPTAAVAPAAVIVPYEREALATPLAQVAAVVVGGETTTAFTAAAAAAAASGSVVGTGASAGSGGALPSAAKVRAQRMKNRRRAANKKLSKVAQQLSAASASAAAAAAAAAATVATAMSVPAPAPNGTIPALAAPDPVAAATAVAAPVPAAGPVSAAADTALVPLAPTEVPPATGPGAVSGSTSSERDAEQSALAALERLSSDSALKAKALVLLKKLMACAAEQRGQRALSSSAVSGAVSDAEDDDDADADADEPDSPAKNTKPKPKAKRGRPVAPSASGSRATSGAASSSSGTKPPDAAVSAGAVVAAAAGKTPENDDKQALAVLPSVGAAAAGGAASDAAAVVNSAWVCSKTLDAQLTTLIRDVHRLLQSEGKGTTAAAAVANAVTDRLLAVVLASAHAYSDKTVHAAALLVCSACADHELVRKSVLLGSRLVAVVSLIKAAFARTHNKAGGASATPAPVRTAAVLTANTTGRSRDRTKRPGASAAGSSGPASAATAATDDGVLSWPMYLPAVVRMLTLLLSQALPLDQAVAIKYNLIHYIALSGVLHAVSAYFVEVDALGKTTTTSTAASSSSAGDSKGTGKKTRGGKRGASAAAAASATSRSGGNKSPNRSPTRTGNSSTSNVVLGPPLTQAQRDSQHVLYSDVLQFLDALTSYCTRVYDAASYHAYEAFHASAACRALISALRDSSLAGVLSLLSAISLLPGARGRRALGTGGAPGTGGSTTGSSTVASSTAAGSATSTAAAAAAAIAASLAPPPLPEPVIGLLVLGVRTLNAVARLDLLLFHAFARAEQPQLYHFVAHLLPHCTAYYESSAGVRDLCRELLLFVGYQTLCSRDAQASFQYGQAPTLLQRLCGLPFVLFTDPQLKRVLFPTLLCVAFRNPDLRRLLSAEIGTDLLCDFLKLLIAAGPIRGAAATAVVAASSSAAPLAASTATVSAEAPVPPAATAAAPTTSASAAADTKADTKAAAPPLNTTDTKEVVPAAPAAKSKAKSKAKTASASTTVPGAPSAALQELAALIADELRGYGDLPVPDTAAAVASGGSGSGAGAHAVPDVRLRFPSAFWSEALAFFAASAIPPATP